MRQAAIDAWFYLQSFFDKLPASLFYWPDRYYVSLLIPDDNAKFTFVYDDRIDLIQRAVDYFLGHILPQGHD